MSVFRKSFKGLCNDVHDLYHNSDDDDDDNDHADYHVPSCLLLIDEVREGN